MRKTRYWIKLYHEVITDAKMGRMDDHTWRRTVELFLLAGDFNQGGRLPPLGEAAWELRTDEDDIAQVLERLEGLGIAHMEEGVWVITNFAARQGPLSDAERSRAYRERKRRKGESVTKRDGGASRKRHGERHAGARASDSDKDSDRNNVSMSKAGRDNGGGRKAGAGKPAGGEGAAVFEGVFGGRVNSREARKLESLEKRHGAARLGEVIRWAGEREIPRARALKAIESAAAKWERFGSRSPPGGGRGIEGANGDYEDRAGAEEDLAEVDADLEYVRMNPNGRGREAALARLKARGVEVGEV